MCRQVVWWHGAVPSCSALPGSWQYARGHEHGSYGQAAWQACGCIRPSSCLVAGCPLVAGTLSGFRSPSQTPGGNVNWCSSRMEGGSLLPRPVQVCSYRSITVSCGALHYFFAIVKLDFVPTAGVSVTVSGFVGAKGSVGTTMSGRLVFREEIAVLPGRHRPVQHQACFFVVANSS